MTSVIQTLSTEASPAQRLAMLVINEVSKMANLPYGTISMTSLAQLDQEQLFWRTYQQSFIEGETQSLPNLPEWAMTECGSLYQLTPLAVPNIEFDGSMWLTPTASDTRVKSVQKFIRRKSGHIAQDNQYRSQMHLTQHVKAVEEWVNGNADGEINPHWLAMLQGLPKDWSQPIVSPGEVGNVRIPPNREGLRLSLRRGLMKLRA